MSGAHDKSGAQATSGGATRDQARAARPDRSVWVSANAGSGKTAVLTNRVARLLLAGADPSRVLCLTFTKAAAAEMQTRLYRTLGDWAMADDSALAAALGRLLDADEPAPDGPARDAARRLFARALETPGGLKIQTIHAFCEGLLGRFPLEAGVSPHFAVLDDRAAEALRETARDATARAAEADPTLAAALDHLLRRSDERTIDATLLGIERLREAYRDRSVAALDAFLGVAPGLTEDGALAAWAGDLDRALIGEMAAAYEAGSTNDRKIAAALRRAAAPERDARETLAAISSAYLTAKGEASDKKLGTKATLAAAPWLEARARALQEGVEAIARRLEAIARRDDSATLAIVGAALIERFEALKAERGALDYDDLIGRAGELLDRAEAREWVRYKLDGGVEHVLVDEAQDTSPAQWRVVTALTAEFFAGEGRPATGPARTVFAVGDEKQSIYGFQGAAPELLAQVGARVAAASDAVGRPFERASLEVSFRSAPAVLAFVDAVFDDPAAREGLSFDGAPVRHRAHWATAPGLVEVWPLVMPEAAAPEPEWWRPVDAPRPGAPAARLAERVAEAIAGWIGRETLPTRDGGRRPLRAGDVLVLVRKRGPLSTGIVRRLKQLGAPVAGEDRLDLAKQLAVKDLLALGRFALLPEDDLTVATLLRSPFCGLDEATLFELAHGREGRRPLYYELQSRRGERAELARAYGVLAEALRRADFERPYEFYAAQLGRLGGRARLIGRLGPQAADPIDEFLTQALAFEAAESPTLVGFLAWMTAREITIKRETEQGRDEVRVMTVHGAKGLEAPVVVLPDTTGAAGGGRGPLLLDPVALAPEAAARAGDPPPIRLGAQRGEPAAASALREAKARREREEHRRLLYVAATRARDRLVICGATRADGKAISPESWYALCAAGAERAGAEALRGGGYRLARAGDAAAWTEAPPEPPATPAPAPEPSPDPDWLARPAPIETKPSDIAPSDLADAALSAEDAESVADEALEVDRGARGARGMAPARYGALVHLLLERLPRIAPEHRAAAAARWLAREAPEAEQPARAALAAEALGVLADPTAAWLFGPGSYAEAPVAALSPDLGPGEIHGVIDRLVVTPERVTIVDWKTGARPSAPPEVYLRQLAVYAQALERAYPKRAIVAALYWTAERALTPIGADVIAAAAARARAELDRRRAGA